MELLFVRFSDTKVLIVASDFPYPPNHGGRVDVWWRIRLLHKMGFTLDLVATVKEDPLPEDVTQVHNFVRNIQICHRRRRLTDALAITPWQVKSRDRLREIPLRDTYDIVLLEGHYVYAVLDNPTLRAKIRVLRIHNNESVYFKELAAAMKGHWKGLYFRAESKKFQRMEPKLHKQVQNMLFISRDEFLDSTKHHPELNSIFMPPAIPVDRFRRAPLNSRQALLLGSLFMENNKEAVHWYIQCVHPLLSHLDGYRLVVAGNSRGQSLSWLSQLAEKFDNIVVVDTPTSTERLYEESSVMVNPMLHGAGVKLKTIEAIQYGLPVVSTRVGNEGRGL
jgi:glycosyltransferase involved in cell wall biosynthesis